MSNTKKSLNDVIDSIRKIQNAMATIKRKNQKKIRESVRKGVRKGVKKGARKGVRKSKIQ